jgi:hypothetical protein
MADLVDKILNKPNVAATLRFMFGFAPIVAMPQFERLWFEHWLADPEQDHSMPYSAVEKFSRADAQVLERAGLLKGLVFKLRWPSPDPTDPRHPWETQLAHLVERNERWSYGRVTKLRLLSITGKLAERLGQSTRTGLGWETLLGRGVHDFLAPRVWIADWNIRFTKQSDYVQIRVGGEAFWSMPQGWRPKREGTDRIGEVFVFAPISRSADEINRIREHAIEHYLINPIEFL